MAIEIPSLVTDRMAHPEWGPSPALERFVLAAGRLLSTLEGVSLPIAILQGLRALAAQGASVEVYLAMDRGSAQIVMDGRRVPLGGAAREALLTVLGQTARTALETSGVPCGEIRATASPDPSAAARAAAVEAQVQESRLCGPALSVFAVPAAVATTVVPDPLMTSADSQGAADALARAIDSSGLFLESHLAQWLRGERSLEQIRDEVRQLPAAPDLSLVAANEQRATTQIEALVQQAFCLTGQAWEGQPLRIQIERERERHREAANIGDPTGMFQATLQLDLPRLGALEVRIRAMENTVAVQIEARHPPAAADLANLENALVGRGLHVARLAAQAPRAEAHR